MSFKDKIKTLRKKTDRSPLRATCIRIPLRPNRWAHLRSAFETESLLLCQHPYLYTKQGSSTSLPETFPFQRFPQEIRFLHPLKFRGEKELRLLALRPRWGEVSKVWWIGVAQIITSRVPLVGFLLGRGRSIEAAATRKPAPHLYRSKPMLREVYMGQHVWEISHLVSLKEVNGVRG